MSKLLLNYTDTYTDFNNKEISDFILYNCGVEYCDPGWTYGPKRRDYHFIHFVKEGCGTLEIGEHKFHVHKNQCFIVPKGYVSVYTADQQNPWEYSWVGFLGIQSDRYVEYLLNNGTFVFDISDATSYEKEIRKIINLPHNSLASALKVSGITYSIFGSLMDELNPVQIKTHNSVATLAKRYIDLNYSDAIKVRDVANFLGVNVNYLSDAFKKETGKSPKQYLNNLRIKKSQNLLATTENSIIVVANSVGFKDSLAFSKMFKAKTNYSPTAYRKNFTEKMTKGNTL
ncbi:AraC family transcriptional regulator [Lactobacillus kalixensis]|uniref:Msm operon regulatory protein n=1 Tax=Lactobacillus kalixensis DSM 16043 TaxID=1423763 RepID=A0A0R1UEP6_9LACO|nr:AraC family transcriptional regulator [Lactobacillus kalixensis]KRL89010.1 msm operon regulatory protein [Lactobacillus kalixensis DSM 16043]